MYNILYLYAQPAKCYKTERRSLSGARLFIVVLRPGRSLLPESGKLPKTPRSRKCIIYMYIHVVCRRGGGELQENRAYRRDDLNTTRAPTRAHTPTAVCIYIYICVCVTRSCVCVCAGILYIHVPYYTIIYTPACVCSSSDEIQ